MLKLVDRLPGTIYQYREWPSGRCTFPYSTPAIEEIFFATPKKLAKDGSPAWKCICPDSVEQVRKAFAESAADLTEVEVTFRTISPQNRIHWIHTHAVPERLRNGSTLWHGYMENITEEYEAQEAAKQQAALLNVIFENIPDHIYYMDRDSQILGANPACCKHHRKTAKEMIGKTDIDLYPPEQGHKLFEEEQKLMDEGKISRNREHHVQPDGSTIHLESVKCPLKTKSGRIIGLAGISRDITAQVEGEQALIAAKQEAEQNAALVNAVFENLPDLLYYKDCDMRIVTGNNAFVKEMGVSSIDELVGKTAFDYLPEPIAKELVDEERKLIEKGSGVLHCRKRFERKNGQIVYNDFIKCLIKNRAGEITGLVGCSRDVTEEVDNEQALIKAKQEAEQSAALVNAVFENLPDLLYYKDCDLKIVTGNTAFVKEMGAKSIDELVGKTAFDYLPEPIAKELVDEERKLIKKGSGVLHSRKRFERKNGQIVYNDFIKCLIKNKAGETIGLVGCSRDVTEEVENEQALIKAKQETERSASFIKAIFDGMEDQFYYKDRNSRVVAGNKAWVKAREANSIDDLIGKTDIDIHPAPLGQQLYDNEQHQMETGEVSRIRERHVRKDGTIRYIESVKCPMKNDKGEVIGLAGVSRDITKQVENERVLIEAQQEAEAANKAKSAFLAMMSHEIRTPMNGVIGAASLILGTELTPQQEEFVHTIQVSGENLLTIINDILDYSKIEAGKIELEEAPFALRECIEDAFDLFVQAASKKNIELLYHVEADVPKVLLGDTTRLRQIIVNLLGNAVKFTEQGEIHLKVQSMLVDESNRQCQMQFSVRDTGIGIPEEAKDRLFQSFTQVDASSTRKYGGTGLGLTISRRLCELMGGNIWFESEEGKGTTFFFTITLPIADHAAQKAESLPVEALRGKHALIVDDNETNRWLLSDQLAQWGVISEAFDCPKRALRHLKDGHAYDIALIDFQMPDMDGAELAKNIHRLNTDMPVLLLSSSCEHIPANPAISARLSKPVKVNRLCDHMLQSLSEKSRKMKSVEHDSKQVEHRQSRSLRVLVAEDNPINLRIAEMMLQRLGYNDHVLVHDGEEAVAAVMDAEYDVVLMDVQMPHMNGLEATRLIREQTGKKDKPWIIALTAAVMQEERAAARKAGMNTFLAKPLVIEQLEQILDKLEADANAKP